MVLHPRYIKLKVAELSASIKKLGFKNVITKVASNNDEGASRMLKVFTASTIAAICNNENKFEDLKQELATVYSNNMALTHIKLAFAFSNNFQRRQLNMIQNDYENLMKIEKAAAIIRKRLNDSSIQISHIVNNFKYVQFDDYIKQHQCNKINIEYTQTKQIVNSIVEKMLNDEIDIQLIKISQRRNVQVIEKLKELIKSENVEKLFNNIFDKVQLNIYKQYGILLNTVTPLLNLKANIINKGYSDLDKYGCLELCLIPIEQITRYLLIAEQICAYGLDNELLHANITDGKATLLYGESGSGKSETINAFNYWYNGYTALINQQDHTLIADTTIRDAGILNMHELNFHKAKDFLFSELYKQTADTSTDVACAQKYVPTFNATKNISVIIGSNMNQKDVLHQLPSHTINQNKTNELYTFYRRTKLINFKNNIQPSRFKNNQVPIVFKSTQYLKLLINKVQTTAPFAMSLMAIGFILRQPKQQQQLLKDKKTGQFWLNLMKCFTKTLFGQALVTLTDIIAMQNLIKECHTNNLKLITDIQTNHAQLLTMIDNQDILHKQLLHENKEFTNFLEETTDILCQQHNDDIPTNVYYNLQDSDVHKNAVHYRLNSLKQEIDKNDIAQQTVKGMIRQLSYFQPDVLVNEQKNKPVFKTKEQDVKNLNLIKALQGRLVAEDVLKHDDVSKRTRKQMYKLQQRKLSQ